MKKPFFLAIHKMRRHQIEGAKGGSIPKAVSFLHIDFGRMLKMRTKHN